jgi:hypothetical protein
MPLEYAKHTPLSLRQSAEFNEAWLHDRIKEDPSILGFGDVEVLKHEHIQPSGGRLDFLLADTENDVRYEVEIMLGPTDPSHIIRCIEYWDVERLRYPAYDHVAVLVAEEITSRFLNVMSLLSGSIPLIAIQLNALRVGEHIVLNFVKVLDQTVLRVDQEREPEGEDADRTTWEKKVGQPMMQLCDRLTAIANDVAAPKLELKYKKSRVSLGGAGEFFTPVVFYPKKNFVVIRVRPAERDVWIQRLATSELEPQSLKSGRMQLRITPEKLRDNELVVRERIHQVVKEHQAGV